MVEQVRGIGLSWLRIFWSNVFVSTLDITFLSTSQRRSLLEDLTGEQLVSTSVELPGLVMSGVCPHADNVPDEFSLASLGDKASCLITTLVTKDVEVVHVVPIDVAIDKDEMVLFTVVVVLDDDA